MVSNSWPHASNESVIEKLQNCKEDLEVWGSNTKGSFEMRLIVANIKWKP